MAPETHTTETHAMSHPPNYKSAAQSDLSDVAIPTDSTPQVICVPAFSDNYLWLIVQGQHALVVDPGDATPIITELERRELNLAGMLITHHHPDHIGGIEPLKQRYRAPVYGPRLELERIPAIDHPLVDGEKLYFSVPNLEITVLAVPGHTQGHVAYYCTVPCAADLSGQSRKADDWLFCGDTLFAAGCGRLFEGTPAEMYASLQRLIALPGQTRVFCAHEYTMGNLAFARAVDPENRALVEEYDRVAALRRTGLASVPTTIDRERLFNPFLRVNIPEVKTAAAQAAGRNLTDDVEVFAALRAWKDQFRA